MFGGSCLRRISLPLDFESPLYWVNLATALVDGGSIFSRSYLNVWLILRLRIIFFSSSGKNNVVQDLFFSKEEKRKSRIKDISLLNGTPIHVLFFEKKTVFRFRHRLLLTEASQIYYLELLLKPISTNKFTEAHILPRARFTNLSRKSVAIIFRISPLENFAHNSKSCT